jgi:hypothetical protein
LILCSTSIRVSNSDSKEKKNQKSQKWTLWSWDDKWK